jgi:hypothetical protein
MCSAAVTGKTGGVDRLAKTQALEESGLAADLRAAQKPRWLKGKGPYVSYCKSLQVRLRVTQDASPG